MLKLTGRTTDDLALIRYQELLRASEEKPQ